MRFFCPELFKRHRQAKAKRKAKQISSTAPAMGKRKSKATTAGSVWSSLPWKKASTSTNGSGAATAAAEDNDESNSNQHHQPAHPDDLGYNHYDDPDTTDARFEGELYDAEASSSSKGKKGGGKKRKMQQTASSGMDGADDPGILFGFEVVDASHFIVKKEKVGGGEVSRVIPVTRNDNDNDNNDDDDDDEGQAAAPEQKEGEEGCEICQERTKEESSY